MNQDSSRSAGAAAALARDLRPATPPPPAHGASPATHCAGRETELAALTAAYRDVQRGDLQAAKLVLLEGPSGMGKSRILTELKSRVRLQGGVVLEGRCAPGRAFGPFAEIVERALRFLDEVGVAPEVDLRGLSCRGGCHRFWHLHGGPDAEQIPFATDDLPGATAETAVFEKRLRFFDTIAGLLREVSRLRAPLIVLDHLERADRGTVELLRFLLDGAGVVHGPEERTRALFVASLRTGGEVSLGANLESLIEHERAESLEVGTLGLEGVRAYLSSSRALQRILERTGGAPELIDLLLEGQPLTPEARLERRLGELDDDARSLVEALSVLGRHADADELASIAGCDPEQKSRADFAACELVAKSIVDGRILFSFERDADRERCYRLLPEARQRALHERCTDVCARSVDLEEAVRHALAAGQHDRAAELAVVAAASLSARHANGEAAALLESFVTATEPTTAPTRAVREQLAELHRVGGAYARALVHARALREDAPTDAVSAHRVGQLLTMAGEHEEAAEVLVEAQRLAVDAGEPLVVAEVEAQLAELHYQAADYDEASRWGARALEAAEAAGNKIIEISARNTLGKLALAQKDPTAAAGLFERNRRDAAEAGLGHQEAQAHTNFAVALLLQQDLRGAEDVCHTAIEVASRVCDSRERAIATENLAVIAHLGRDYGNALRYYHQAVGLLKRLGNRAMLARVANNLGELYLTLGDRHRARALCEFARRIGGKLPGLVLGEGLLLLGRIDAADGNVSVARDSFRAAQETFQRLGSVRASDSSIELARIALFDGDVALARSILSALPVELPAKHQADLALVMADLERAAGGNTRAAARRSVELAEKCDDPERLLHALLRHARALGDAGDVGLATRVLERAQKIESDLTARVPDEAAAAWQERAQRQELNRVAAMLTTAWTRTRHESDPPPRALTGTHRTLPSSTAEATSRWNERYPSLIGRSPAMSEIYSLLDKVSGSDALVLVRGESGTGKELIAEAIHKNSPRRNKPIVKVNCAALVETLLLSELFGHERGSFTGASARKKGRFELADGGTIFLDEIGDISAKTQVALLRVLQEREFERVGGTEQIKVDVRIVAATHRDLEAMVREGTFREDLYYRLRGVVVEMPPLRSRLEDIGQLCQHLLGRIAEERGEPIRRMSPEAVECLQRHRWPGNVRELENVLRSATLFADGAALVPDDFRAFADSFQPPEPAEARTAHPAMAPGVASTTPLEAQLYERVRDGETSLLEMKKIMERECIVRALGETEGNITRAAALLGMKRPRLSQLVKQYELNGKAGAEE
ncbi:MAG: sigma 54-interacting transcriptional regulator [Sandaracinaceae bacterium]|nr:sigma 54-interacting transcriptional regulator [Sandaracinaceae bacterium]